MPAAIEFTPAEGISTFQVTSNQGKHFLLNQSVSAGKKIVIDFKSLTCTVNGATVLSSVSLNSNFADFRIDHNTKLTFNANGNYVIRFEVKNCDFVSVEQKQDVIGIVSSDVISATLEEQINTAGSLKFVVAKKLSAGCQYVLIQRPGAATYMCFKILTETQEDNQVSYTAK